VTLLVNPEDAETLTLAGSDGRIQLVLRNSSDQTVEKTQGRYVTELYNGHKPPTKPEAAPAPAPRPRPRPVAAAPAPAPAPVAVVAPPPPPDQIVVIRGTTRTVETIPNGAKN
jgi:pilus assembly protein CpaB